MLVKLGAKECNIDLMNLVDECTWQCASKLDQNKIQSGIMLESRQVHAWVFVDSKFQIQIIQMHAGSKLDLCCALNCKLLCQTVNTGNFFFW